LGVIYLNVFDNLINPGSYVDKSAFSRTVMYTDKSKKIQVFDAPGDRGKIFY